MTVRTFDAVLRKRSEKVWASEALHLPKARVVSVLDDRGSNVPFETENDSIVVDKHNVTSLSARIELLEDLVAESAVEQMKLSLEREKVASADRLGRRTLWVSVVTAILSAAAALGGATIASHSTKADKPQLATYRDLDECREGLNNLKTLAALDQQTLPDLRAAVRRQVDACSDRLKAAMSASPS
jgi:hypothetical protein